MQQMRHALPFQALSLTRTAILAAMGYAGFEPGKGIIDKTDALLEQAGSHADPSFSYAIYDGCCEKDTVRVGTAVFHTGRIILHALRGATRFAVFTATAGTCFQQWMEELNRQDDMVDRYIADCIGSEIAEATVGYMQKHVAAACREEGDSITNRYSPGYCGWDIREQHLLFSLLNEENRCGIRLMNSGLMYPIKSVSGIIGIGKHVRQEKYGCPRCNYAHCFRRKLA